MSGVQVKRLGQTAHRGRWAVPASGRGSIFPSVCRTAWVKHCCWSGFCMNSCSGAMAVMKSRCRGRRPVRPASHPARAKVDDACCTPWSAPGPLDGDGAALFHRLPHLSPMGVPHHDRSGRFQRQLVKPGDALAVDGIIPPVVVDCPCIPRVRISTGVRSQRMACRGAAPWVAIRYHQQPVMRMQGRTITIGFFNQRIDCADSYHQLLAGGLFLWLGAPINPPVYYVRSNRR